jgi:hypothetical protein
MARRRAPFIQVLAPAVTLFGLGTACTSGKRHDDGDPPVSDDASDDGDDDGEEETGDTGTT